MQKADGFKTNKEVLYFSEDSKTRGEDEKTKDKNEELGVETRAVVDSIVYERSSFFLGIPLIIVVFGGIASKHESIFSIEHEGKTVIVLYHGLCLVSAGDRLLVHGKWYRGKSWV
jgi:hypothetical protein